MSLSRIPNDVLAQHMCRSLNSWTLCELQKVDHKLYKLVYLVFKKNLEMIFKSYVNEGTVLDACVSQAEKTYSQASKRPDATINAISMTISEIQKNFVLTINRAGVPCIGRPLKFQSLKFYNLALKRATLNFDIWWRT